MKPGRRTSGSDLLREDQSRSENDQLNGTVPREIEPLEYQHPDDISPPPALPRSVIIPLFISHFLSTWNSRAFEMGAILFLAAIYPDTLRPMSVYALVRSAAAILLSPAVGSLIDTSNRLSVIRLSIVGQRLSVAASCVLLWLLQPRHDLGNHVRGLFFAATMLLACVEKLCAVMNLVSVERDWVVVIARETETALRLLNAQMRRIDLFCKLLGPLVISVIAGASIDLAIWVTLGLNCASVLVEYFTIARVYQLVPELQDRQYSLWRSNQRDSIACCSVGVIPRALKFISSRLLPILSIPSYFQHSAFLPSFSLALLYLTVLSFSGRMITFLLSTGYNSSQVGVLRAISTAFELSATWLAPSVQRRIGPIRGGIWFLAWQMAWLGGGLSWFFVYCESRPAQRFTPSSGLVGSVILSRVGLWGFDLCAQTIVQEEVGEDGRGSFSATEVALQNLFELLSYASTIMFSKPEEFRWPVVISVAAVYIAGGVYAIFARERRGHLLHAPGCMKLQRDRDIELH